MMKSHKPEIWVSVASAFIALAALGASIYDGYLNRKHNILSVTPQLLLNYYPFEHQEGEIGIKLVNRGLGPAVIKKLTLKIDDKAFDFANFEGDGTEKMLDIRNALDLGQAPVFTSFILEDSYIDNDSSVYLLFIRKTATESQKLKFANQLHKVNVSIDYESIYGEIFGSSLSTN